MVLAYRNDEEVLQARLGSLLDSRSAEIAGIPTELRDVYARRVARAVAGGLASLGGAAVLLGGGLSCIAGGSWGKLGAQETGGTLVALLGGSVLVGALALLPARLLARRAFDSSISKALSLSGSVRIDLVRVERAQPRRIARDLVQRHEALSASLPLVAAALLAPLGIHLLIWFFATGGLAATHLGAFDTWIALTAPIAGLAHLVLAGLGARFGLRLRERSTAELRIKPSRDGWIALAITAFAGMIPGALLVLIPPVLIGLTGLAFIPYSFYRMNRAVLREREIVDDLAE